MEQWLTNLPLGEVTGTTVLVLVAGLVITRKLVWHTDLTETKKELADTRALLFQALGVADKVTTAAEVTNDVLTRLPPARDEAQ